MPPATIAKAPKNPQAPRPKRASAVQKQQQLSRIRKEFENRNGIERERTGQPVDHLGTGNGVEITAQHAQGAERATSQLVSGYQGLNAGIPDRQTTDREFYRWDGRDDEQDEYSNRGVDTALSPNEGVMGGVQAAAPLKPVRPKATKKVPPVTPITPDKPEKEEPPKRLKLVSQPMTTAEANGMRQKMYDAFVGIFQFIDDSLQMIVEGHEKVEIWSTIDDPDIMRMVDRALMNAQKSVIVAQNVRRVVWLWDQVQIGAILMPRFIQSFQLLSTKGWSIPGTKKGQGLYARQVARA